MILLIIYVKIYFIHQNGIGRGITYDTSPLLCILFHRCLCMFYRTLSVLLRCNLMICQSFKLRVFQSRAMRQISPCAKSPPPYELLVILSFDECHFLLCLMTPGLGKDIRCHA